MLIDESVLGRLKSLGAHVAKPGEDVVSELVSLYRRDSETQLDRLKTRHDVDRRGLAALADTAHALKGASLAVGATQMAALARDLELAAKDDDAPQCTQLIDALDQASLTTWDALDAFAKRP